MSEQDRNQQLLAEIERRRQVQVLQPPPKLQYEVGEGQGNPNSSKTLEKLRGLTRTLSARLSAEREAHIVKITTMATELVDVQNETIEALEARIVELGEELSRYRLATLVAGDTAASPPSDP